MKKIYIFVVILLFCRISLFAQVTFDEIIIRHDAGTSLVRYGFTNTYESINSYTIQYYNMRIPQTLEWVLFNDLINTDLRNEMNKRNVNFAFKTYDENGNNIMVIFRRVGRDFFQTYLTW